MSGVQAERDERLSASARRTARDLASPAWWREAFANGFFRSGLAIAALVVAADQAVKHWILYGIELPVRGHVPLAGPVDLTYTENTGVSFGLFAGGMLSRVLLSLLAVLVAIVVVHWLGRLTRRIAAIGAGFIVGGALGNVYDRVLYGFVVDFIDASGLGFPWIFNVADAAINIGVACLAWDAFVVMPKLKAREEAARFTDEAASATTAADQH